MLKAKRVIPLSIILFGLIIIEPSFSAETYTKVNNDNYVSEVLESNAPLIVFFYADWCPYSGALLPVYEKIEKIYSKEVKFCRFLLGEEYKDFESDKGKAHWKILKENYNVTVIPTLIMFKKREELDRMCGRPEKEIVNAYSIFLKQWIDSNLIDTQENPYHFEGTLLLHKK